MIEIGHTPAKRLVTIRVSGKLTSKEYDTAVPEIEQAIQQSGGRLNAVVGGTSGEKLSAKAAGALTSAEVEFFRRDQVDKAEDWAAAD